MKVREVMNREIETCSADTDLAGAAMIMWRNDCGVVPVVEAEGKVRGVITDRDICMAVATQHRTAESIRAHEIMSKSVHSVRPEDDVRVALDTMKRVKIRRVPVTGRDGKIAGMISINDLILHASDGQRPAGDLTPENLLSVLKSICEHQAQGARAHA